jgi:hypothetical protein
VSERFVLKVELNGSFAVSHLNKSKENFNCPLRNGLKGVRLAELNLIAVLNKEICPYLRIFDIRLMKNTWLM